MGIQPLLVWTNVLTSGEASNAQFFKSRQGRIHTTSMFQLKLSTLATSLGFVFALPHVYGVLKPAAFAAAARKFPRYTPIG